MEITGRDRIRTSRTDLKVYWIGCKEDYGVEHLEDVIYHSPDLFGGRCGIGSIYQAEHEPGCVIKVIEPLPQEPGNAMARFHNYEGGRRLGPGEEGACLVEEINIFAPEFALLRDKYHFNIPEWMEEFAVGV